MRKQLHREYRLHTHCRHLFVLPLAVAVVVVATLLLPIFVVVVVVIVAVVVVDAVCAVRGLDRFVVCCRDDGHQDLRYSAIR